LGSSASPALGTIQAAIVAFSSGLEPFPVKEAGLVKLAGFVQLALDIAQGFQRRGAIVFLIAIGALGLTKTATCRSSEHRKKVIATRENKGRTSLTT